MLVFFVFLLLKYIEFWPLSIVVPNILYIFSSCKILRLKCRVVKFKPYYCKFWAFFSGAPFIRYTYIWTICWCKYPRMIDLVSSGTSFVVHKEFYHNYKLFTLSPSLPVTLMSLKFGQLEADNIQHTYFYRCTIVVIRIRTTSIVLVTTLTLN